jgi:hypothetical protein
MNYKCYQNSKLKTILKNKPGQVIFFLLLNSLCPKVELFIALKADEKVNKRIMDYFEQ